MGLEMSEKPEKASGRSFPRALYVIPYLTNWVFFLTHLVNVRRLACAGIIIAVDPQGLGKEEMRGCGLGHARGLSTWRGLGFAEYLVSRERRSTTGCLQGIQFMRAFLASTGTSFLQSAATVPSI